MVPQELFDSHRFATAKVADAPPPEPLRLPGSVVLDPNRYSRVHSLFSGQVAKVGIRGDMSPTSDRLSNTPEKGLRPGDEVKRGQILATVWSKDVGAMKTDLVNQVSQLRADKNQLDRYLSVDPGIITQTQMTTTRRAYENDLVMVRNAERNLRSAQFTEEEIEIVKREAEKLKEPTAPRDLDLERTWAEYPIRATFDGVIVEKNVTVGDVVDPTTDLYKVAKLDRLQVLVNVYEEDLPKLQRLARAADAATGRSTAAAETGSDGAADELRHKSESLRAWTINFQAEGTGATEAGYFDRLGVLIDPMQHTGTVTGWVENKQGKLFIGQFVTATVALRPDPSLVAVPTGAVIEDMDGSSVLVATDPAARKFERRKVAVAVRGRETIFLRKTPTDAETARGAKPVLPSETVVSRGAIDLANEFTILHGGKK
ncbi:putative Co/Zn/Cd efflux system membrane fusion protein [Fimbriiglobus ruber]|uniref:Putative Co/Zn/Cd efflux system membrane fusion protein n=1 Tax=Fimbriiglobus ruber TaxID=1908690 RepID=A0A225D308_9BACT|nr:putative Co/Zn/Cd efflux system membrane fusion protein [Fimbriiglobus ruber]